MDETLRKRMDQNGIIVITSGLDSNYTNDVILCLLNWDSKNPEKELKFYISCASNDYLNVITIFDVMQSIRNPISGYAIGLVSGCATLLLAGCNKGKRYALKNTEIGLSEISGIISNGVNQETEIEIVSKETTIQKQTFEELLAKHTGQPLDVIEKDCKNEKTLTAEEAIKYGLIDKISE